MSGTRFQKWRCTISIHSIQDHGIIKLVALDLPYLLNSFFIYTASCGWCLFNDHHARCSHGYECLRQVDAGSLSHAISACITSSNSPHHKETDRKMHWKTNLKLIVAMWLNCVVDTSLETQNWYSWHDLALSSSFWSFQINYLSCVKRSARHSNFVAVVFVWVGVVGREAIDRRYNVFRLADKGDFQWLKPHIKLNES